MRLERCFLGLSFMASSAGCHAATAVHIPNFDGARVPEPIPFGSSVSMAEYGRERVVEILHRDPGLGTRLNAAALRAVSGSECRVKDQPYCGATGSCFGMVDVHGDVCVLLVSAAEHAESAFEPYCHDLSSPQLSEVLRSSGEQHPVWDRCAESVRALVDRRSHSRPRASGAEG